MTISENGSSVNNNFAITRESEFPGLGEILGPMPAVWLALRRHCVNGDPEKCFPSNKRLAEITGFPIQNVKNALARLIKSGLVQVFKIDGRSHYGTTVPPKRPTVTSTYEPSPARDVTPTCGTVTPTVPDSNADVLDRNADVSSRNAGVHGSKAFEVDSKRPIKREVRDHVTQVEIPINKPVPEQKHEDLNVPLKAEVVVDVKDIHPPVAAAPPLTPSVKPEIKQVFEAWREATGRGERTNLDAMRTRKIEKAIKTFGFDTTLLAVRGVAKSDWHMGRDPKTNGKKYNDLDLVLRDAAQVEKFAALMAPPTEQLSPDEIAAAHDAEVEKTRDEARQYFLRNIHGTPAEYLGVPLRFYPDPGLNICVKMLGSAKYSCRVVCEKYGAEYFKDMDMFVRHAKIDLDNSVQRSIEFGRMAA